MNFYHPEAETLYKSHHDLFKVFQLCSELARIPSGDSDRLNSGKVLKLRPRAELGHPFAPELCARSDSRRLEKLVAAGGDNCSFILEPKYDGERLQLHVMGDGNLIGFSRRARESLPNYLKWLERSTQQNIQAEKFSSW